MPSARRKSDHLAITVRKCVCIGELHTPVSPRIEPRSAEHGIEVRLERADVPSTLLPYRTRCSPHRPHRRRTCVCRHERVDLRGAISSRTTQWEGTHRRRLDEHCPRPSPQAHRAEHGARDLHRMVLRRRAYLHLIWAWFLPDEAKAVVMEFPPVLSTLRPCAANEDWSQERMCARTLLRRVRRV